MPHFLPSYFYFELLLWAPVRETEEFVGIRSSLISLFLCLFVRFSLGYCINLSRSLFTVRLFLLRFFVTHASPAINHAVTLTEYIISAFTTPERAPFPPPDPDIPLLGGARRSTASGRRCQARRTTCTWLQGERLQAAAGGRRRKRPAHV